MTSKDIYAALADDPIVQEDYNNDILFKGIIDQLIDATDTGGESLFINLVITMTRKFIETQNTILGCIASTNPDLLEHIDVALIHNMHPIQLKEVYKYLDEYNLNDETKQYIIDQIEQYSKEE